MTESTRAESLYDKHRDKVWEDIKAGTESFDRNLLSFSSGALGLSLAFIKDMVPLGKSVWISSLFISWIAFALCIVVTMASFQISIRAQQQTLAYLKEYYLEGKAESFDKQHQSVWSRLIDWCTFSASVCFAVGIVSTMLFVGANVREVRRMSQQETATKVVTGQMEKSLKPAAMTPLQEGHKPAGMTPLTPATQQTTPVSAGGAQPQTKKSAQ
jgi:hypothetical protein